MSGSHGLRILFGLTSSTSSPSSSPCCYSLGTAAYFPFLELAKLFCLKDFVTPVSFAWKVLPPITESPFPLSFRLCSERSFIAMQFKIAIGCSLSHQPVFIFAQRLTISSIFLVYLFTSLVIVYMSLLECSVRADTLSLWFIAVFLELRTVSGN